MSDTWPMLIAAGYLRRGLDVPTTAARTGLSVAEVTAIAHRLHRADQQPGQRTGWRAERATSR